MNTRFLTDLKKQILDKESHICVGLDSDYDKLPQSIKINLSLEKALFLFNKEIIDKTHDITTTYKSNIVFYSGYGVEGLKALIRTNTYIRETYPEIKILADCKRSEMVRSAQLAAKELFEEFLFDGFTATPWFGWDTIEPYRKYEGKAVFVICHDSNPSAGEIQDLQLQDGQAIYEYVTKRVTNTWNTSGNIFIEAPLTYPNILQRIKELSDEKQFFLLAGLGAQGGNIQDLKIFKDRKNFLINASRSVIFASNGDNFAEMARKQVQEYNTQIRQILYQ